MLVTTKYKRWQFVLELVALGLAVCWFVAAIVLYNNFAPEEQVQKRNMLLYSMIFTALIYLGFTFITLLPSGNALIRSKKYIEGSESYRYRRESTLRNIFQFVKLVGLLLCILLGTFSYFSDIAAYFAQ